MIEIIDFKAWNIFMPPGKRFIAIARVRFPTYGMSARFQKRSHSNDEITLEVVVEFSDAEMDCDEHSLEVDIRYDEEGVSYEGVSLVSGERVEVGVVK